MCCVTLSVDITSCLLWDSALQNYVGILSVSDFIEALLHMHQSSTRSQLESQKITEWRGTLIVLFELVVFLCAFLPDMTNRNKPLISIEPEGTLLNAMQMLVSHNIHRLPIVHQSERNDVLFIIKHSTLLWDIIASVRF